jgi:hypothetical protein
MPHRQWCLFIADPHLLLQTNCSENTAAYRERNYVSLSVILNASNKNNKYQLNKYIMSHKKISV